MKNVLIVVDLQNDFLPGGALAVSHGDEIIPIINQLLKLPFDAKVASKDWHPKGHASFASTHQKQVGEHTNIKSKDQILWPDHCIQNSFGAEFAKGLDSSKFESIFYKGTCRDADSYSVFFDDRQMKSTGLIEYLKRKNIEEIFFAGLATDYCVKYSALDALKLGFKTHVITDGCKAVNLNEADESLALEELKKAGAILENSQTVIQSFPDV